MKDIFYTSESESLLWKRTRKRDLFSTHTYISVFESEEALGTGRHYADTRTLID